MFNKINLGLLNFLEKREPIEYKEDNISAYFPIVREYSQPFILESKDVSRVYGRLSLIGFDPVLKVTGKDDYFEIELLNERGKVFFENITEADFPKVANFKKDSQKISGNIKKEGKVLNEEDRVRKSTVADSLRVFLTKFKTEKEAFLGFYGAFAYDFVRLFEELPDKNPKNDVPDFVFFIYDSFLYFNHLKEKADIILYRENKAKLENDFEKIKISLAQGIKNKTNGDFKINQAQFDLGQKEYEVMVKEAKELARQGTVFEVVFSRSLKAKFQGDAFGLYQVYREKNPSPYLFYFDFGANEYLVGASPEMMLRVEKGLAHVRPISGTAPRSGDIIKDHENMLKLLNSEKERSELDMLIDLGRNDLARICEPGIEIKEYRTVEKYSRVMHTVAHVTGKLRKDFSALDAYIACANAGTLTGAPKVEAMIEIEKNEKTRRGFYGGGVGYLSFSGNMDTGIIIRSAHIRESKLELRVGATLLYESDPKAEYLETEAKAQAFLDIIK